MLETLLTLFYFILALFLLVTVHEYGHFLVARYCGVKVLRFSFGFGKVLASWYDKKGTEYAWSLIPLGGYVKMLDEREGHLIQNDRSLAFDNQSVQARMAIVLAGPFFNLLFAFIALWLVLVIGMTSLAPMIGDITPASIAAQAGLTPQHEILSLDGKKTSSWRDVQYALMPLIGTHGNVEITVKPLKGGKIETRHLPLAQWTVEKNNPDILGSLGITPFVPSIPPIIGEVVSGTPAALAGLQTGDLVQSMNGTPISDWLVLVDFVKLHPNAPLELVVNRQGQQKIFVITLSSMMNNSRAEGLLGVRSQRLEWPTNWLRTQREGPMQALHTAFHQTIKLTGTTFLLIGRLAMGQLPLKNLSGPLAIAQGARESSRSGASQYLSFLALISISLGVLNLLPIPMLDGGQFLFFLIEFVTRRPIPQRLKSIGVSVGILLMISMMLIALSNDVSRLIG